MGDNDRTIFCANLSEYMTEELLYELFLQAGPVEEVRIPMSNGKPKSFGFVTFKHECSVPYATQLLRNTVLFGERLSVRPSKRGNQQPQNHSYLRQPQQREMVLETRLDVGDYSSLRGISRGKRHSDEDLLPNDLRKRLKGRAPEQHLDGILNNAPQLHPHFVNISPYEMGPHGHRPIMPVAPRFLPISYPSQAVDFNGWNCAKEDNGWDRGSSRCDNRRWRHRSPPNRSDHTSRQYSSRHHEHRRSRY